MAKSLFPVKSNVSCYHAHRHLFFSLFGLFEIGSHCVAQTGLEYTELLLPQPPGADVCGYIPSMVPLFSPVLITEPDYLTLSFPERVYGQTQFLEKE